MSESKDGSSSSNTSDLLNLVDCEENSPVRKDGEEI